MDSNVATLNDLASNELKPLDHKANMYILYSLNSALVLLKKRAFQS